MRTFILFIILLTFGVGIVVSVSRTGRYSEQALRTIIADSRDACGKQGDRTAFILCFRKRLQSVNTLEAFVRLMEFVTQEYTDNAAPGSQIVRYCHDITHAIGQRASEVLEPTEALRSCSTVCGAGCYHGVVEGLVAKGKAVSELVTGLCDTPVTDTMARNRWACFHGLGHGVANITGSLEKSFALCGNVQDEDDKKNCDRGAFMELTQSASFLHANVTLPPDVAAFCARLSEPHKSVCYENAGVSTYTVSRDAGKAFAVCENITGGGRKSCVGMLGNMMYHESGNDISAILTFCNMSSIPLVCVQGAVHESVLSDPLVRTGKGLCAQARETIRLYCFEYLGQRTAVIYGEHSRAAVCADVETPYMSTCSGISL